MIKDCWWKPTAAYINDEQGYYGETIGSGIISRRMTEMYARWSETHTLHFATRQGFGKKSAYALTGKGHTARLGYYIRLRAYFATGC